MNQARSGDECHWIENMHMVLLLDKKVNFTGFDAAQQVKTRAFAVPVGDLNIYLDMQLKKRGLRME